MSRVEGFAQGRLTQPLRFELNSAGPQPGQYNPTPRYPDGTPVKQGFSTGSNRGRKPGDAVVGHAPDAKAQMIERYKAGEGLQVLAAAYSTHARRVREILVQAGVEIRPIGSKNIEQRSNDMALTKEQVKEIFALDDAGVSRAEIANRMNVTTQGVDYHLNKRPAKRKLVEQPAHNDDDAVAIVHRRYMAGESMDAMYRDNIFSVTPETMVKQFRKRGLVYPRPAAPPADDQMDDPETVVAAAPQPSPATPGSHVIHVEELMLTRRPYAAPRVLQAGPIASLVRPQNAVAVAGMVRELVEELNTIPGVRADFGFSFQMTAGVRA